MYTVEEICSGCMHAIFHECCGKFCNCAIDKTAYRDTVMGHCRYMKTTIE